MRSIKNFFRAALAFFFQGTSAMTAAPAAVIANAALPPVAEPSVPSGVFQPYPRRKSKHHEARVAAFRARVNRRKPGRYKVAVT